MTVGFVALAFLLQSQPASNTSGIHPVETVGTPVRGLEWRIQMARAFTTFDRIQVEADLVNRSGKERMLAEAAPGVRYPNISLARDTGEPQVRAIPPDLEGGSSCWVHIRAKDGELMHRLSLDLRCLFGRLKPARYTLQFVYPKHRYAIPDWHGFTPQDLPSPRIEFTVHATSVGEANAANTNKTGLDFIIDPPELVEGAWKDYRTATLTNRLDHAIEFRAYCSDWTSGKPVFDTTKPLATLLRWERWLGPQGWHFGWASRLVTSPSL